MSLTREERLKIDLATEARIRADAAAERTRKIAAWMKGLAVTARGHRDRMAHIPASWQSFDDWANRLEVLAEEMEQEFDDE